MRFRGKAALTVAMLGAALAFNKPPMHDAYAKGNSSVTPKYEPKNWKKGDGKAAKALKEARNVTPKNYKIEDVEKTVENGLNLVSGMKINNKGFFVFNIGKITLNKNSWITGKVKIKYKKKKDELYAKVIIYTKKKNKKGTWICGIPLNKLAKEYKKETKKQLEYVTFGFKKKQNGDFDMYIIPVETLQDAEKGNIKPGVPFLIIPYDAQKKNFKSHFGRNIHNLVE